MKQVLVLMILIISFISCDRENITIKGEEVIYIKCTLGICDVVTEKGTRYVADTLNLEKLYDQK